MTGFVAERVVEAKDANGTLVQIRFGVDVPQEIDDASWGCRLLMEGAGSRIDHRVVGCDAWQALTLAIRLVEQMLTYFVEDGGCLYWIGTCDPMAISDVVPRASKAKKSS